MPGGAYLTALLAQQGGAADQKVNNYQNAVGEAGQLRALMEQQREFDARQAQSQKQFDAQQTGYNREFDYRAGRDTKLDTANDLYDGKGLKPPPGLLPKNHGVMPTPEQKANNALTVAAWYASQGAGGAADKYERQARDYASMSNNDTKNALGADKEAALESYRAQVLAQKTQLHNSDEQFRYEKLKEDMGLRVATLNQRGSEFQASFGQKDRIANMSQADRVYVAQLAAANAMNIAQVRAGATLTKDQSDNAMRAALNQYDQEMATYRSQGNSLNAGFRADAIPGTFNDPTGGGQGITINLNGVPQQQWPNAPIIPGANGAPAIPSNPGAPRPPQQAPAPALQSAKPPGARPVSTWMPNPYSPAAVKPDPVVDSAAQAVVADWPAAKAKHGATPQNLAEKVKTAFPALNEAQVAAVVAKALAKLGLPQPIVGPAGVTGPANPFQMSTP